MVVKVVEVWFWLWLFGWVVVMVVLCCDFGCCGCLGEGMNAGYDYFCVVIFVAVVVWMVLMVVMVVELFGCLVGENMVVVMVVEL